MNNLRCSIAAITLPLWISLCFVLPAAGDDTQVSEKERLATVRGIRGIFLVVEEIVAELPEGGVSKVAVQKDAESRLRDAGIRLMSAEEFRRAPGGPCLRITVETVRPGQLDLYAFHVRVEMLQDVTLARDPLIRTWAPTWSSSQSGVVGGNNLKSIGSSISARVDEFVKDYLLANSTTTKPSKAPFGSISVGISNKTPPQPSQPRIRVIGLQEHTIMEVIGSGRFIRLDDGSTWQVDQGEESMVEGWGSVEVVLKITDVNGIHIYEILNTEDDEEVSVTRVR